jgi:hypothetical protein
MPRPKKNVVKSNDTNIQNAVETLRSADVTASLAKMISSAGIKQAPPQAKKNDRWELELDPKTTAVAEQFVGASTVLKAVESRVDAAKEQIVSYCSKEIIKKIWENKSKPSNPEVLLKNSNGDVDHRFIFMCQDRLKVEHPAVPEDADIKEFFVNIFVDVGLSEANAKDLVEKELDFNPVTGIRSLTELLDGYYGSGREWIESRPEEKTAGVKLSRLLMWDGSGPIEPLTPAEKALVVKINPNVVVKSEFLNRVAMYCENLEQLEGIFSVIKPVYSVGHIKFAINDSEAGQTQRKINSVAEILGQPNSVNG